METPTFGKFNGKNDAPMISTATTRNATGYSNNLSENQDIYNISNISILKNVTAVIESELYSWLKAQASQNGLTLSQYIRGILKASRELSLNPDIQKAPAITLNISPAKWGGYRSRSKSNLFEAQALDRLDEIRQALTRQKARLSSEAIPKAYLSDITREFSEEIARMIPKLEPMAPETDAKISEILADIKAVRTAGGLN